MRGTEGQDAPVNSATQIGSKRRRRYVAIAVACLLLVLVFVWLVQRWAISNHVVSLDRVRMASVTRGHFVRDVSAQGTVIAPVSPTLFAIAPGTVSYAVRAGDTVKMGQVLATLDSPELSNEYKREQATLDSLDAAIAHQEIEIRRQLLTSQQQADLARVTIEAAERERKRADWAWDLKAIPERDYRRAIDDLSTAKLNYEHARATAALERESVVLDLRTRRLERERQALMVEDLKKRVSQLTVTSPVSGMVANLAQLDKTKVAESAPLVTVVDLSALEIEFEIAETYAGEIKPGMAAQISLGGHTEEGAVTTISPEVRQNEVTGRIRFATQPQGLRQNERASVRIVLDERADVVKFERGSLIDEVTRAVYVVRGDRAVRVPVELGAASISEVEVVHGLAVGDRVIVSDTRDFADAPQIVLSN